MGRYKDYREPRRRGYEDDFTLQDRAAERGPSNSRPSPPHASELVEAVVCTGFPYGDRDRLPQMIAAFGRFTELARGTRRLGSAAIDLAYVAAGRLDGFWEQGLKAWDIAAGQVLVEEAGGAVTRFDGSPLDLAGGEIAASGPGLQAAILEVLEACFEPTSSPAR